MPKLWWNKTGNEHTEQHNGGRLRRILMLAMMVLSAVFLCAFRADAAGRVSGLRIGQGIGSVRIVFDADAEFDYNVFSA